ncbi:hypothetical protein GCM10011506_47100 [Marivirga lumbricoides]|uniref:Outer membrane protein beta-barrel domain-containing protein n=1 Tax=Marivirga lumbricoides TaxID=1046115 RepID=A0ABQ1NA10_9BACT|nr:hypothetical protein GCM10011506_47100 [Marivirga lumbricoides]
MKNKDWKNKISNHAPEVNDNFWDDIEQRLPKKRTNRVVVPLILLGLLLLSVLTFIVYTESSVTKNKSSSVAMQSPNSEDSTIKDDQKGLLQSIKDQKAAKKIALNLEDTTTKFDHTKYVAKEEKNRIERNTSENSKNESLNTYLSSDNRGTSFSDIKKPIEFTFDQLKSRGIAEVTLPLIDITPVPVIIVKTSEEDKKADRDKAIKLYFNTSLFSAYHKINPNLLDDKVIKYIDNPAFSWDRLGYKLSGGINKKVSDRLYIYLGISYLYQSQRITYGYENTQNTSITVESPQENTLQIRPNKVIAEEVLDVKNQSAGLHVGLAYKLVQRVHYSQAIDLQLDLQHQMGDKSFYGAQQYYVNLAYNNLYQLNSWLSFKVSPVISYTINEFAGQSNRSISLKPYSLGIDFGLTIHLKH